MTNTCKECRERIQCDFTRDTDQHAYRMRYIEEEMAKRKGKSVEESTAPGTAAPDGGLFELPEHLKVRNTTGEGNCIEHIGCDM